jgi:hypothetical protein
MPAPLGSRNNPNGRPRSLERELERLDAAVTHIDRLTQNRFVAAVLMHSDRDEAIGSIDRDALEADRQAREALVREARHVRRAVEALRRAEAALAPDVVPIKTPHELAIAAAAVALDRLVGDGEQSQ